MNRRLLSILALLLASAMVACDPQKISELEEGVSTEADVRRRFGEPEKIWDGPAGARIFEYNRQPAGTSNYMITVGTDDRMSALRQVLTPQNFALVTAGMMMEDVRRRLGKPMRVTRYDLKRQTDYDWRYQDGPNQSDRRIFTVSFDADLRVVATQSSPDPDQDGSNRR